MTEENLNAIPSFSYHGNIARFFNYEKGHVFPLSSKSSRERKLQVVNLMEMWS